MIEGAKVNPVWLQFGDGSELFVGEGDKVVGGGSHDPKCGLAIAVEFNLRGSGVLAMKDLHELGRKSPLPQAIEGAPAAIVVAHRAHQESFVAQLLGVSGKVQGSAAEILVLANHIPQDLSDSNDSQSAGLPGPQLSYRAKGVIGCNGVEIPGGPTSSKLGLNPRDVMKTLARMPSSCNHPCFPLEWVRGELSVEPKRGFGLMFLSAVEFHALYGLQGSALSRMH